MRSLIFTALLSLALGAALGHLFWPLDDHADAINTIVRTDTVRILSPAPVDSSLVRCITKRIPVLVHDTLNFSDTLCIHDTVFCLLNIPISQRIYQDSAYLAFVSGYNPSLDSIFIFNNNVCSTIVKKPPRWNVGVMSGFGLGLNSKNFQPFIGIGVSYRLF